MIYKQVRSGYIMIFALFVITAIMILSTYVFNRSHIYFPFSRMALLREKAKCLTTGGLEIARAQLSKSFEKKQEKQEKQEQKESEKKEAPNAVDNENTMLLHTILPSLNRWQEYALTKEVDGIDGTVYVCIMSEEGKININHIYDFEKKEFTNISGHNWKELIESICTSLEKVSGSTNLFKAFEKILKERKYPFNDATELLTSPEFASFKDLLFFEPPSTDSSRAVQEQKKEKHAQLYLTDIFTVWTKQATVEPWLFSNSIAGLLGLPQAQPQESKSRKEKIGEWLKHFKQKSQWSTDWDVSMKVMYGKELRSLPKNIDSFMSTTFDPTFFSVLVYGQVDDVIQRVYGIMERVKHTEKDSIEYDVILKKLYWL